MVHRMECGSWYGEKFPDLDCEDWLPYMEAASIGMEDARKVTIPIPCPTDDRLDSGDEAYSRAAG